jgi:hypothetical protein
MKIVSFIRRRKSTVQGPPWSEQLTGPTERCRTPWDGESWTENMAEIKMGSEAHVPRSKKIRWLI